MVLKLMGFRFCGPINMRVIGAMVPEGIVFIRKAFAICSNSESRGLDLLSDFKELLQRLDLHLVLSYHK
jgi:hypothetical protein